jgi:ubiquinone/menaquinone biosynthesis C-methylase UbiE
LGIDIIDAHLELARSAYAHLAPRLSFEHHSVFALDFPERSWDLTVCRHVLHSIPHPERVLAEFARITRRGGYLHLIQEDYGMLHFQRGKLDPGDFWQAVAPKFGAATGTDLFVGRNSFGILAALGLESIRVDYVVVDTLRVPREIFARMFEAWRDGYVEPIAEITGMPRDEVAAYFAQMIATIRDPTCYAVWMVPVVSAQVPL